MHITGDGLLNLTRVVAEVGYVIEELPAPPSIFALIQQHGHISDAEMFSVYNMGIGFCIVVPPTEADRVLSVARSHQRRAYKIGHAIPDEERRVFMTPKGLMGKGKRFFPQASPHSG